MSLLKKLKSNIKKLAIYTNTIGIYTSKTAEAVNNLNFRISSMQETIDKLVDENNNLKESIAKLTKEDCVIICSKDKLAKSEYLYLYEPNSYYGFIRNIDKYEYVFVDRAHISSVINPKIISKFNTKMSLYLYLFENGYIVKTNCKEGIYQFLEYLQFTKKYYIVFRKDKFMEG